MGTSLPLRSKCARGSIIRLITCQTSLSAAEAGCQGMQGEDRNSRCLSSANPRNFPVTTSSQRIRASLHFAEHHKHHSDQHLAEWAAGKCWATPSEHGFRAIMEAGFHTIDKHVHRKSMYYSISTISTLRCVAELIFSTKTPIAVLWSHQQ